MRQSKIITLIFIFAIFAVLAPMNSWAQFDSSWPQFRHDNHNSGNNRAESKIDKNNVNTLKLLKWSPPSQVTFPYANYWNTSPVVANWVDPNDPSKMYRFAYVIANSGGSQGDLYAIDVTTGEKKWTFHLDGAYGGCVFPSSPAAEPLTTFDDSINVVYVFDGCGTLYAVNAIDGTPIWNKDGLEGATSGPITSSPMVAYSSLDPFHPGVFLSLKHVWALDAHTGDFLPDWKGAGGNNPGQSVDEIGGGISSPAAAEATALIASEIIAGGSLGLWRIEGADGTTAWPNNGAGNVLSSPSSSTSNCPFICLNFTPIIYGGTDKEEAFSFADGHAYWSYPGDLNLGSPFKSSPAVGVDEVINGKKQDVLYVGSDNVCLDGSFGYTLPCGHLTALDLQGNKLWQSVNIGPVGFSSPAVANGVVYVADQYTFRNFKYTPPTIYAFDATGCPSGPCSPLWSYTLPWSDQYLNLTGSPAVADAMVFVTTDAGLSVFGLP